MKISGFVICYNQALVLETCLQSLRFVDELIVIDKSSTDRSNLIAQQYADRVVTIPWSPTVEETRATALELCSHDFIVFLDDDECLSVDAIKFFKIESASPSADIYDLPCRHHILGRHDERAYYWPDRHCRAFQRGGITFLDKVHGGMHRLGKRTSAPDIQSGICFHNISHAESAVWIEKTNRYTSIANRAFASEVSEKRLIDIANDSLTLWASQLPSEPDDYLEAVAILRSIYDMVDAIKAWEQRQNHSGKTQFSEFCADLRRQYQAVRTYWPPERFNLIKDL